MRYDVASVIRQAMLKIKSPVKDFEGAEKILKLQLQNHPTSDLHVFLGWFISLGSRVAFLMQDNNLKEQ
jgi:hypothetical protein